MPPLGAPASVELLPAYADGLLRAGKHSHFWILAWLMGRPERELLQVTPRGVDPNAPDAAHGVFAVRSPARPNPIGLTAAKLLRLDGLRLEFDRLDFQDGTPVLDLKPYFVSRDAVFAAHSRAVGKPKSPEAMRESLWMQAANFCGEDVSHPDIALAVEWVAQYREQVLALGEPEAWDILAPANRPFLLSGLMGVTRARLGRGLTLQAGDAVSINGWNGV